MINKVSENEDVIDSCRVSAAPFSTAKVLKIFHMRNLLFS